MGRETAPEERKRAKRGSADARRHRQGIRLTLFELGSLRRYAESRGLSPSAAARELLMAGLLAAEKPRR